jgi:uncharacterized protein (TIGR02246 family)
MQCSNKEQTMTTETHAHPTPAPGDIAAIQAVFDRLIAAWNRGDGAAYGALFTPDADYIDVTGTHTQGGAAIGQMHQFLFDGPLQGSRLDDAAPVADRVQFLAPDVALLIGGGASRLAGQAAAPADRQSVNTTVLVKRDGAWHIRAFQNNRVQARPFGPPAGAPGTLGGPR